MFRNFGNVILVIFLLITDKVMSGSHSTFIEEFRLRDETNGFEDRMWGIRY